MGKLSFRALNTPGHSPDSLSIVLSREGRDVAVFTGDTLFIGDVGRPNLRESKALAGANSSTIGAEKAGNPMLRAMSEENFINELLADQPFIPKCFGYDVALNKAGAPAYAPSVQQVPRLAASAALLPDAVVV